MFISSRLTYPYTVPASYSYSSLTVLGGLWPLLPILEASQQNIFMGWGFQPHDNSQPGEPRYPFLSGSSPLTCLAWETVPVFTLPPAKLSGSFHYTSLTTTSNRDTSGSHMPFHLFIYFFILSSIFLFLPNFFFQLYFLSYFLFVNSSSSDTYCLPSLLPVQILQTYSLCCTSAWSVGSYVRCQSKSIFELKYPTQAVMPSTLDVAQILVNARGYRITIARPFPSQDSLQKDPHSVQDSNSRCQISRHCTHWLAVFKVLFY